MLEGILSALPDDDPRRPALQGADTARTPDRLVNGRPLQGGPGVTMRFPPRLAMPAARIVIRQR